MNNIFSITTLLVLALFFSSCKECKPLVKTEYVTVLDTIYIDRVVTDTLYKEIKIVDSARIKELQYQVRFLDLTIQGIEDYVKIARNNSSQTKFLVGWLNRPLNDYKDYKKNNK